MRPRGDRCQIKEVHAFDTHSVVAVDPLGWGYPSKVPLRVDGTVAKVLGVHGLLLHSMGREHLGVEGAGWHNEKPVSAREWSIRRVRQLTTCCQKR